jgi:hypothetical protein
LADMPRPGTRDLHGVAPCLISGTTCVGNSGSAFDRRRRNFPMRSSHCEFNHSTILPKLPCTPLPNRPTHDVKTGISGVLLKDDNKNHGPYYLPLPPPQLSGPRAVSVRRVCSSVQNNALFSFPKGDDSALRLLSIRLACAVTTQPRPNNPAPSSSSTMRILLPRKSR